MALSGDSLRGDGDVDDGRGDARGDGLHGVIERDERGDAAVVERSGGGHGGGVNIAVMQEEGGGQDKSDDDGGDAADASRLAD